MKPTLLKMSYVQRYLQSTMFRQGKLTFIPTRFRNACTRKRETVIVLNHVDSSLYLEK